MWRAQGRGDLVIRGDGTKVLNMEIVTGGVSRSGTTSEFITSGSGGDEGGTRMSSVAKVPADRLSKG